jgi:pimeloyl-ACP methyl ester carboxylesterase
MRVACLIPWIVFGLGLPGQVSNLFGQSVTALIHDVSNVADGSVTQARLEAQRQAMGAGPAYRSSEKDDSRSFSGRYTPPELSEDKKGRFVYGLAVFSDDGSNVTVDSSPIHQRLGQAQHLPHIGTSFHELQTVLAPGEPIDITVNYSNIIYNDDPDSPDYPDIDGCTLFLYLIPAAIAVDANRDGTIAFSGEARDNTSQDAPFRFWCNDDNDGLPNSEGDVVGPSSPDHEDGVIQTARDLEDFTRLWIKFDAFQKEISEGTYSIGLKWKKATGSPSIKLYKSTDTNGSDSYLKDEGAALKQISGKDTEAIGTVAGETSLILPKDLWSGSSGQEKLCLLFEGSQEGMGRLVLTIEKSDGTEIGEGPGVWLDLKNIKKMYQRVDSATAHPWDNVPFEPDPHEDRMNAIVFVHGWRMSPEGAGNFAETFYKRLWHRGFRGRFAAFHWDTWWHDGASEWLTLGGSAIDAYLAHYNDSEYTAWHAAAALKNFVDELSFENKNLAAHSMGNIVAGEALRKGMAVKNYALMQAAVPAACYDEDEQRIKQTTQYVYRAGPLFFAMWDSPTPDNDADPTTRNLAYRGTFTNVGSNLINFCQPQDYATSFAWEINNDQTKPPLYQGETPNASLCFNFEYDPNGQPDKKLWKFAISALYPTYYITYKPEAMAYGCRTWGKAVGAESRTEGSIDESVDLSSSSYNLPGESSGFGDEHSGQFRANIQQLRPFYNQILTQFDITPNP